MAGDGILKPKGSFSEDPKTQARQTQEFERSVERMSRDLAKRISDLEARVAALE